MLDPGKPSLPGLWSGASLPLPDVQGYFGGDRTIVVGEGGLDQVTVPRCDPAIVRDHGGACGRRGRGLAGERADLALEGAGACSGA